MKFLDTNIFLRYLVEAATESDRSKQRSCIALFAAAQAGTVHLTASESVIHEALYVLCSARQYGLTHQEAVARLRPLFSLRAFHLPQKRLVVRAVELFASHDFLDFADAMCITHAPAAGHDLLSYDTDFDRIPGVTRQEP